MTIKIKKFLTLSLSALLLTTSAYAQQTCHDNEPLLKQISKGFSNVAKTATPAVVYIEVQGAEKKNNRLLVEVLLKALLTISMTIFSTGFLASLMRKNSKNLKIPTP